MADLANGSSAASGRRRDIIEAAAAIAAGEGWRAVTVRGIAKRVGCSAAALYQYFPDKQGIVAVLADEAQNRLADALRAGIGDESRPVKRLRAALAAYWRFAVDYPSLFALVERPNGEANRLMVEAAGGVLAKRKIADPAQDLADRLAAILHGAAGLARAGGSGGAERAQALFDRSVEDVLRGLAR